MGNSWFDSDDFDDGLSESIELNVTPTQTTQVQQATQIAQPQETVATPKEHKESIIQRIKDTIGVKKFVLIIVMLIAVAILVIVALVFGEDTGKKPGEQKETQRTQQQIQQQTQTPIVQQPSYTPSQSNTNDWKDITGASFTPNKANMSGTFTVTEVHIMGRNTGGTLAGIELQVELYGTLYGLEEGGYDGIYKIIVPYADSSLYRPGLVFNVTYKRGTSGNKIVIYDLTTN